MAEQKIITDKKVVMNSLDNTSFNALFKMKDKGIVDYLGGVVQSGKESNIFSGCDSKDNPIIVKIYLIDSNSFNNMIDYIRGDPRFIGISSNKRKVIFEWCRKEYSNLTKCTDAGMDVPKPIYYRNNVLVMEPITDDDNLYSRPLSQVNLDNPSDFFEKLKKQMKLMLKEARLIHADLSEFNILVQNTGSAQNPIIIDMGQSVLPEHPRAKFFLERDMKNICSFFKKEYDIDYDPKKLIKELTE